MLNVALYKKRKTMEGVRVKKLQKSGKKKAGEDRGGFGNEVGISSVSEGRLWRYSNGRKSSLGTALIDSS